jgi:RHS repeat-associated protein
MPRMGCVVLPLYPHHIVQRGHNRQVVFAEPRDYERYVETLRGFKDEYGVAVYEAGKQICHLLLAGREGGRWVSQSSPIADQSGRTVWRWDSEPFGSDEANEDPDGDGDRVGYGLRFPGQYYDREAGLYYNHRRWYEPKSGRYTTSDPLGLNSGLNTYGYVRGNPLSYVDPLGLDYTVTVNDTGGRDGATYGGTLTITNNGQTVSVPTSSWPNSSNASPGVAPGTYDSTYSTTGHQGTYPGVRLNNGGNVPTNGPNPAQGGEPYANGINVHCGASQTNRGSAGCITIQPDRCQDVWEVLQSGDTGTVTITR